MNILLDFIPFQNNQGIGGAASFAKAVYDRLAATPHSGCRLFAAFNSAIPSGLIYGYQQMAELYQAELVDISTTPLSAAISQHHIDVFFIAIGQYYEAYDIQGINCKTIMFIHDIFEFERADNKIDLIIYDQEKNDKKDWLKRCINLFSGRWDRQVRKRYGEVMRLYAQPNTLAYTVSNYSRNALHYYFPEIKKDIRVCYSPIRMSSCSDDIENKALEQLVQQKRQYILMLAANRRYKNAQILTKVYKRLQKDYPDLYLLTLKYGKTIHSQHIDIPYLSDSDLEHAYKHAYVLVFPSFLEGFGYPPVEAMKYGTPTVASNVTSIPEVMGDAAIYFSPFYPADLYRALKDVLGNHDIRKEQILSRRTQIAKLQEEHLSHLVSEILSGQMPSLSDH